MLAYVQSCATHCAAVAYYAQSEATTQLAYMRLVLLPSALLRSIATTTAASLTVLLAIFASTAAAAPVLRGIAATTSAELLSVPSACTAAPVLGGIAAAAASTALLRGMTATLLPSVATGASVARAVLRDIPAAVAPAPTLRRTGQMARPLQMTHTRQLQILETPLLTD